ncbi:hypothetical protein LIER_22419 [Lithospermum erythrorhizon]|uniref:Uncharacterized protein n=1 Tax=Lithospermum erythrorhizon TaxID=34254 RepID=A0AAV3QTS2_LITER
MQETLHISTTTTFPSSHNPNNSPPSLSRPKHLHFPPPPPPTTLSKDTISKAKPQINIIPSNGIEIEISSSSEKLLYLDSLGIDSLHCLSTHPRIIQTPLPQMKSTVEFLYSIKLSIQDIRRCIAMCPEILTSSVSTTLIPAVTFLVRDAHVDTRDLRHVIHRRPRLLICSVHDTLRPTLRFLQQSVGVEDVSKCAPLLSCSVQSKFLPTIQYIQNLGVSEIDTFQMLRRFPALFCYSMVENLEPKFNYFVVEMGRDIKELVDFPHFFSFSLENRIKPRHRLCVEKGVFLALPVMLKLSERRFRERLEVCCCSSMPQINSPFWCSSSRNSSGTNVDVNLT